MWGAKMWGAKVRGAKMWGAKMRGAKMWGAKGLLVRWRQDLDSAVAVKSAVIAFSSTLQPTPRIVLQIAEGMLAQDCILPVKTSLYFIVPFKTRNAMHFRFTAKCTDTAVILIYCRYTDILQTTDIQIYLELDPFSCSIRDHPLRTVRGRELVFHYKIRFALIHFFVFCFVFFSAVIHARLHLFLPSQLLCIAVIHAM